MMRLARGVRGGLAFLLRLAVDEGLVCVGATAVTGLGLGREIAFGVVPALFEGDVWGGAVL